MTEQPVVIKDKDETVVAFKLYNNFKNDEFFTGIKNGVIELIERWK